LLASPAPIALARADGDDDRAGDGRITLGISTEIEGE